MSIHINNKNVIITNDISKYYFDETRNADLVIVINNAGTHFNIHKNRYGFSEQIDIPIQLLTKILENPSGTLAINWI